MYWNKKTGRCAILFPHGVLFRDAELDIRKKMIEADVIECVLGLGPKLFYNSPMYSCVVICRWNKRPEQKGKIQFIDASKEVTIEKTQSFLEDHHRKKILNAYQSFKDIDGFAKVVPNKEILTHNANMSVQMYVRSAIEQTRAECETLDDCIENWEVNTETFKKTYADLVSSLGEVGFHE